ncbi:hypothetical protein [Priestia taiwanensis]|uniref:Uncharacterized protein n=1 Tax=Priestia taiwanensis TaxID=1347902 RepID=A0A917ANM4_9BACI|nr:hypothetical protein [Priestia taiwanensis]MBM7362420.1 membrane protease subunit (stomatin/prohibitin family) [Priestia taiwanensis]GGE62090.1 hypothetical protein GCM10007140_10440 [Priestia taiwanensis]
MRNMKKICYDLETTPLLYGSGYLNDVYEEAITKKQKMAVYQHLNKHDVYGDKQYKGYYALSQQIQRDFFNVKQKVNWEDFFQTHEVLLDTFGEYSIQERDPGDEEDRSYWNLIKNL